jgi:toxin ParE1/3/4
VKGIVSRVLANRDVEEAIDHYLVEATAKVALGFVDELEKAYAHIGRHPESGSPRYSHQLGLADLRFWRLGRYPYLIFYVERDEHIDVWRVLHEQRDIPAWMSDA